MKTKLSYEDCIYYGCMFFFMGAIFMWAVPH